MRNVLWMLTLKELVIDNANSLRSYKADVFIRFASRKHLMD